MEVPDNIDEFLSIYDNIDEFPSISDNNDGFPDDYDYNPEYYSLDEYNCLNINSDNCQNILTSSEFINLTYSYLTPSNIIHEKMFLRIYKKNDNSIFEENEIVYIKKAISSIIYSFCHNIGTNLNIDLDTNLFLCHKDGRHEELVEKNILLCDGAIKEFETHYEINQKYIFNQTNDYYYDIPLYFDHVNSNNAISKGFFGYYTEDIQISYHRTKGSPPHVKYEYMFFSEKMTVIKNFEEYDSKFSENLKYFKIVDGYRSQENIRNSIIKTKHELNIEGKNIEYFLDIFNGYYYYYFNTLDFQKLLEQTEDTIIYEPSPGEKSSILKQYVIILLSDDDYA